MRKDTSRFESEDAEREFWATHDSGDYVGWSDTQEAELSALKPTLWTNSLRLPVSMIEQLKPVRSPSVAIQARPDETALEWSRTSGSPS